MAKPESQSTVPATAPTNESQSCDVGDCRRGEIEVRYDEPEHLNLDEIVAMDATVHLEKMEDSVFALIIESPKQRACFWIAAKNGRSHVIGTESWREDLSPLAREELSAERTPTRPDGENKIQITNSKLASGGSPDLREKLAPILRNMRENTETPDVRPGGYTYSWKPDHWADEIEAALSSVPSSRGEPKD